MKILRVMWAIWGVIVFVVLMLVCLLFYLPIFWIGHKNWPHQSSYVSRKWALIGLWMMFIRVKAHGLEKLDKKKAYVFITNHRSQLDIPVSALSINQSWRFLSKAELGKIPLLGYIIRKMYILVDRGSKQDRLKSFERMKRSLDEGISVYIYPEGTRNRTKEPLKAFYDGAFRLAIDTGTPLAVITTVGSSKLQPVDTFQLSPGVVHCYLEEVIETKGMGLDDVDALSERAKGLMRSRLEGGGDF